jgi:tetratricopeptide (TPR) repeat protein
MGKTPFYLCTGFHRSGTSLVASTLASNNVNMGDNLMGPSFANRNGHFEDIPMVALHDKLLNLNATDWRFFADQTLEVTTSAVEGMRQYLEKRKKEAGENTYIGGKDPRALLFLNAWHEASDGNLKTIMVFRDWQLSVSSLLKRHSRELIQFTTDTNKRSTDMQFWSTPDLAAKMWLSSANLMLNWFKKHAHDTLLFDQSSFICNPLDLSKIAAQKGFEPTVFDCRSYEKDLMQTSVPESMQEMMSESIRTQCILAQQELCKHADIHLSETVSTRPSHHLVAPLIALVHSRSEKKGELPSPFVINPEIADLAWQDLFSYLSSYRSSQANLVDWEKLLANRSFDANQLDKLFALLMKWGIEIIAQDVAMAAIKLKPQPWRYMHLGDSQMRQKQFNKAEQNYQRASEMAPENATFYARLANVQTAQGNYKTANRLLDKAIELDMNKLAVVQAIKYLKDSQSKSERVPSTKTTIVGAPGIMPLITNYNSVVDAITENRDIGMKLDKYMCQSAFVLRDNRKWINDALASLPIFARACFADYMMLHLNKLFPTTALATEFLLDDENNWLDSKQYKFIQQTSTELPTVGICIHAFYPNLLPQIFSYIANIPNIKGVVITCSLEDEKRLVSLFSTNSLIEVIALENRGRDILPWLTVADDRLHKFDVILKLHTKKTPHQPELSGWRNQLYWQLMDADFSIQTLKAFANNSKLGMVIPNYHPKIVKDINWGKNYDIAQQVASRLNLNLPKELTIFAAGSMFWYRPKALSALTKSIWRELEFTDELGQTDGTIVHAIERIISLVAENSGYSVSLINEICLPLRANEQL